MVVGVLLIAYAGAVVFWRDPVTDLYAIYQQRDLGGQLGQAERTYEQLAAAEAAEVTRVIVPVADPGTPPPDPAEVEAERAVETAFRLQRTFAKKYTRDLGAAIGRLTIPRLDVSTILVEGTDYWSSLAKGPGRYGNTAFPGAGATVGVAGHRTTFSAPFRHIDRLEKGDQLVLKMPYATFTYRVRGHRIVDKGDWSIIEDVGHEQLVLSACHPLYSASQRWVVFGDLVAITLPGERQPTPV